MRHRGSYHIALVVEGGRSKRLARLTRILAGTFEEYGHPVERSRLLDENMSAIVASHYRMEVTILRGIPQTDQPFNLATGKTKKSPGALWRVEIALIPENTGKTTPDALDASRNLQLVLVKLETDTARRRGDGVRVIKPIELFHVGPQKSGTTCHAVAQ